ncbi:hypothetical protein ACF1GY_28240 [Streptomyces sp. NPDC014684]|uniref:hypothetical protein n=1 Tax=unclassified Streptomyces TaxID=2593676 RepID=UPI0033CA95DE
MNPALVADPDKAIDNTRNQCSAINGKSPRADDVAQTRFSNSTHTVSPKESSRTGEADLIVAKHRNGPSCGSGRRRTPGRTPRLEVGEVVVRCTPTVAREAAEAVRAGPSRRR